MAREKNVSQSFSRRFLLRRFDVEKQKEENDTGFQVDRDPNKLPIYRNKKREKLLKRFDEIFNDQFNRILQQRSTICTMASL